MGHSADKYFQITRKHTLPAAYTCILPAFILRGNYIRFRFRWGTIIKFLRVEGGKARKATSVELRDR